MSEFKDVIIPIEEVVQEEWDRKIILNNQEDPLIVIMDKVKEED